MASRYVAHVFPKPFRNGASRSNYYWYHRCFHIPHTLNFYCLLLLLFCYSVLGIKQEVYFENGFRCSWAFVLSVPVNHEHRKSITLNCILYQYADLLHAISGQHCANLPTSTLDPEVISAKRKKVPGILCSSYLLSRQARRHKSNSLHQKMKQSYTLAVS